MRAARCKASLHAVTYLGYAMHARTSHARERPKEAQRQQAGLLHRLEMMPCSQNTVCRAPSRLPRTWYASNRPSGKRKLVAPVSAGGACSGCSASSAMAATAASATLPRQASRRWLTARGSAGSGADLQAACGMQGMMLT